MFCSVLVGGAAYLTTDRLISDARAQGMAEMRDAGSGVPEAVVAGPTDVVSIKVVGPLVVADPIERPAAALSEVKKFWNIGGFQFVVFVLLMLASAINMRMKPADTDGDGHPDPVGWRGKTWAITGAVVMVATPLLAVLIGEFDATWNAVGIGVVSAFGLLMTNINPKRGAKHVAV